MPRARRAPASSLPEHALPDPLLSVDLLDWYAARARSLPWRGEGVSPYRTWVSEVMLQQTRVEVVKGYFERWMQALPTVQDLANAPLDDVLALWSGLGYYSRARNLHAGAKAVVAAGGFPSDLDGWRALPGVGAYIAGAVGSIALGLDEPAVDGNLERVLARVHAHPGGRDEITHLARRLIPRGRAGDWNQALMDVGATICGPRSARCELCPLHAHCAAARAGDPLAYPTKKQRRIAPQRIAVGALIDADGKVLLARRAEKGLFGGLFELPGALLPAEARIGDLGHAGPTGAAELEALAGTLAHAVAQDAGIALRIGAVRGVVEHTLTHMHLRLYVFAASVEQGIPAARPGGPWTELRWLDADARNTVGLSTLASKALAFAEAPKQGALFSG